MNGRFTRAKFIRQKCYIEEIDDKLKVTCAGLPDNLKTLVTFKNFEKGFSVSGKLTYKRVKGGVILVETDFTIKP